jgi:NAD(P)H-dependent FMN reductase
MNKILEVLQDAFDTLESQSDSDLDFFEDDDEERECAPMQYAARKIMQAMSMLQGGDCK